MILSTLIILSLGVSCNAFGDGIKTIHHTSTHVLHMEMDATNSDRLIYSEITSLRALDLFTWRDTIIAGDEKEEAYKEGDGKAARFKRVSGFVQIGSTHFVVVDMMNRCLRKVYRNGTTQEYVGKCTRIGFQYGSFANTRFVSPIQIRACGDFMYMLDHGVHAIIKLDPVAQMTYKLAEDSRLSFPRDILFVDRCSTAYVTFSDSIMKVDLTGESAQLLTSNDTGTGYPSFRDGPLSTSKYHNPVEMLAVTDDVFVVADNSNNRLRVISRHLQQVKSVCTGWQGFADGPLDTCQLLSPWSLALSNERKLVYVGEFRAIKQVGMDSLIEMFSGDAVVGK